MFLINSRSHLVSVAPRSLSRKDYHLQGRTFSRSYGTILPSSFTRVLSSALVFSTYPPVSVWGTVRYNLELRGFSWKHGISYFDSPEEEPRHHALELRLRIFLEPLPTRLNRDIQHPDSLAFSVSPSQ